MKIKDHKSKCRQMKGVVSKQWRHTRCDYSKMSVSLRQFPEMERGTTRAYHHHLRQLHHLRHIFWSKFSKANSIHFYVIPIYAIYATSFEPNSPSHQKWPPSSSIHAIRQLGRVEVTDLSTSGQN